MWCIFAQNECMLMLKWQKMWKQKFYPNHSSLERNQQINWQNFPSQSWEKTENVCEPVLMERMSTFFQTMLLIEWTAETIMYWHSGDKFDFSWLGVHFLLTFWIKWVFICQQSYYLFFWSTMSTFSVKIVCELGSHLCSCMT